MNTRAQNQLKASPTPSFTPMPTRFLQRRSTNQAESSVVSPPPILHEVLRSPGQPLDPNTRTLMESCFGHDFSQVRVHTDLKASQSAQAVNALAYTVQNNIVFAAGHYSPAFSTGKKLLAHELSHVVQQTGSPVETTTSPPSASVLQPASLTIGQPEDRYEQQAEQMANQILARSAEATPATSPSQPESRATPPY